MSDGVQPRFAVETHRINSERVPVELSNGVAEPGRLDLRRVLAPIDVNDMEPCALLEQKGEVFGVLHDLDGIAAHVHGTHHPKRQAMAGIVEVGRVVVFEVVRARR